MSREYASNDPNSPDNISEEEWNKKSVEEKMATHKQTDRLYRKEQREKKQTHYKKAKEIEEDELEFPEPKATQQYKKPIGPKEPAAQKKARLQKKTISTGGLPFAGVGKNYTELSIKLPPPAWLNSGGKKGKRRLPSMPPSGFGNVPDWVMTGRAPWEENPALATPAPRRRPRRAPPQPKPTRPNWIVW